MTDEATEPKDHAEVKSRRSSAKVTAPAAAQHVAEMADLVVRQVVTFVPPAGRRDAAFTETMKTTLENVASATGELQAAVIKANPEAPLPHSPSGKREIEHAVEKAIGEACKRNGTTKKAFEKKYMDMELLIHPEYAKSFVSAIKPSSADTGRGF